MQSLYMCQGKHMLNEDIITLINRGIKDQKDLLDNLINLGHNITQSTISRKLKQLGIIKLHGKYQRIIGNPEVNIDISFAAPNMIVVKTAPGHAGVVAAKIDNYLTHNEQYPEFLGSIAGDDTIFIVVDITKKNIESIIVKLKEII